MSIETYVAKLAAGNVYINIETTGSAVFTDLLDMSPLTYDFDLKTSEDTASLGTITGAMTIEVEDQLSNGGSAYDVLDSIIGDYSTTRNLFDTPISNVTLYFDDNTNVGNYKSFPFDLYFTGIGTNENTNITSIELRPKAVGESATNADIVTNINTNVNAYNGAAINVINLAAAGDYIESALSFMDTKAETVIFETGSAGTYVPKIMTKRDDLSDLYPPFTERSAGLFINPEVYIGYTAAAVVSKLAGIEGAIFGGGFGTSFYMPRTINSYNVTLTENTVTSLSFEKIYSAVSNINVAITNSVDTFTYPTPGLQIIHAISNANVLSTAWEYGSQSVKVGMKAQPSDVKTATFSSFQVVGLGQYEINKSLNTNAITEATKSTTNVINAQLVTQNILETASQQYLAAQGVQRFSNGDLRPTLTIQTEVIGVRNIRPYQVIKFDSSVPSRYQSKHFRPSSLEYNFKKDLVRVSAYEIP